MEAEIGMVQPQECLEPAEARHGQTDPSLESPEEAWPFGTLVFNF